jgi:hypothetical protein
VHRSETRIEDGNNPKWGFLKLKAGKLCGGDQNAQIKVVVKVENEGEMIVRGEGTTTLATMIEGRHSVNLRLNNAEVGSFSF